LKKEHPIEQNQETNQNYCSSIPREIYKVKSPAHVGKHTLQPVLLSSQTTVTNSADFTELSIFRMFVFIQPPSQEWLQATPRSSDTACPLPPKSESVLPEGKWGSGVRSWMVMVNRKRA